ncbi:MAG: acylphosphatase [Candidatus Hydrogenedentes bacterium]|jgi:acylphosphatase|nr:acylphosphatase [Candidatus Hydrogenedentota bacterium]
MTESLHVVISGRVQGVGFRFAAQNEARRHGLIGWVRNRSDGTVEALFEGERTVLESMLLWCGRGSDWAAVEKVVPTWGPAEKQYATFKIIR